MRFGLILISLLPALTTATLSRRQANLPSCAVGCLSWIGDGCTIGQECHCSSQQAIWNFEGCLPTACEGDDLEAARNIAGAVCSSESATTATTGVNTVVPSTSASAFNQESAESSATALASSLQASASGAIASLTEAIGASITAASASAASEAASIASAASSEAAVAESASAAIASSAGGIISSAAGVASSAQIAASSTLAVLSSSRAALASSASAAINSAASASSGAAWPAVTGYKPVFIGGLVLAGGVVGGI